MPENQRPWWKRPGPWTVIVALLTAAVTAAFGFVGRSTGLGWASVIAAASVVLIGLAVRFRDEILDLMGEAVEWVADSRERSGRFFGTNAPGSTVPVALWLAGFAVAAGTAYYLPRSFPEFAHAQSLRMFLLLAGGQVVGQALAYRLTRSSAGDLVYLRELTVPAPSPRRGTPDRPTHPDDVIDFFLDRFPRDRHGHLAMDDTMESVVRELGAEWRHPFRGQGVLLGNRQHFRDPYELFTYLANRYYRGMDRVDALDLKSDFRDAELRHAAQEPYKHHVRALFAPEAAASVNEQFARRAGFVVDDAWSRLKLVLPPGLRVRHQLAESTVTSARFVVAVGVGWVEYLAALQSLFALVPLAVIAWAVLVGRRQLVRAYEMRTATADVYRFELAERMRLALPASQTEFAALGTVFTGELAEWDLAPAQNTQLTTNVHHHGEVNAPAVDTSGFGEQLVRAQQDLTAELRHAVEQLDDSQRRRIDEARHHLSDLTDRRLSEIPDLVVRSVGAAVSAPPMANFTGYLAIEQEGGTATVDGNTVIAAPSSQVGVVVSLLADSRARDAAPERGTEDDAFLVLQPVHIEGGRNAAAVDFDLVVDSATVRPSPRRHEMSVARPSGQSQVPVSLLVPDQTGRHEVWLQLFQSGQLVQMVAVVVEARSE